MNLNIYNEKVPAEEPVRLTLRGHLGHVALMVVDEDGLELDTILTVCSTSNDIHLSANVDEHLGFKLDDSGRVKIRKEKTTDG